MKKLLFSLLMTAFAGGAMAQEVGSGAQIEFKKDTHDYGNVKYGGDGSTVFEFKNTGNAPLIIATAKASCGCTIPDWTKEPVAPGKVGTLKVTYDTKRPGLINKSITVTSNAVNEPTKILRIKGEVGPKPETGMPENNAGPMNK